MPANEPINHLPAYGLRERYDCDGCGAEVICLYDGAEHWQNGAIAYRSENGLFTFCADCADKGFPIEAELTANA